MRIVYCRLIRFALLCLTLQGAGSAVAQQDPQPPAKFPATPQPDPAPAATTTLKLSTRIVVLDVVVTDRKGRLMTGLKRDDFTIVEDKQPQTIRSFEPPSAHVQPASVVVSSSADLKRIGDAPVTLLVLDALNTRFEDTAFCRQALVKYLQSQPAVLVQPTALLMVGNTRFQQLADYTQSRDLLIDRVKKAPAALPYKQLAGRGGAAAVERMAQSLAAIEQIAQASAGTAGRKNVIWVGDGFPSADLVGLDLKTQATITSAVRRATDMLLTARVTMYTIDPTLNSTVSIDAETPDDLTMAQTDNGGEPYAGSVQFATFAPATGGRSFFSRNDIGNEIGEGISAGNTYYTLSYAPSNRTDDAANYRHIRIVMKDPNLRATTRDGYYPDAAGADRAAVPAAPKQARAQLQLDFSSAVNSAITYNGLAVKATHVGANYVLQVKSLGLDWHASADDTTQLAEVSILAAWYGPGDKLLGHSARELTVTRKQGSEPAEAVFLMPADVPVSAARLRFIVRDAANAHIGTVDLKP